MKIDTWDGCYPSDWRGKIVPDAITHPAKYSSKLIRRIYDHMIDEGWLHPGDLVIDPFGGVALGALDAMRSGLRWRGNELEPRFVELGNQNIDLWNRKFSVMPGWCSDAVLLQGDSRNLLAVLADADGSVSSPPYADSLSNDGVDAEERRVRARELGISNAEHVSPIDMEKVGKRKKGYGLVSSPPYAESMGNAEKSGIDWSKQNDRDSIHPHGWNGESYSAAGALSSPPYSTEVVGRGRNSEVDLERMKVKGYKPKGSGGMTDGRLMGESYGSTPGQLGAMKSKGFEGAVSSPPFLQAKGGTPEPKPGGVIDEALYKRQAAGNSAAKGYGETEGQLANMGDGDFEGAVSSPPYAETRFDGGLSARENGYAGIAPYSGERADTWRTQRDQTNLGNNNADDFWSAARVIVEQVYIVLRPGAHACWVVKGFVKNKQLVDFPGQWMQLCEAVGFETVHEHHAMLVRHNGTSHTLEGGTVEHITESKSFFRRLAEKKGSPRIDYETVLCMVKK